MAAGRNGFLGRFADARYLVNDRRRPFVYFELRQNGTTLHFVTTTITETFGDENTVAGFR